MKAWILNEVGDIRLEETKTPFLKEGEVLIKVKCAGICGSDIPRIYETGAHNMPLIIGHEFAGVVEEIGREVPSGIIGSKVGVYPLIPCRKCLPCKSNNPQMCRHYDYIGSRRNGAFAEYVCVPYDNIIKLADNVSFEEAAMLEPMAVAFHAIRQSGIVRDSKIVVCGLGTIGLLIVMLLIDMGCSNIYVVGNKTSQMDRVKMLGIEHERFCNSKTVDVVKWTKDNIDGADLYFECVGRPECLSNALNVAAPGGTIVTVGNPASDINLNKDTYWKILRNELTLKGTWNSRFLDVHKTDEYVDDWQYVCERLEKGAINPKSLITHRFSLDRLDEGFRIMRDKSEDYCKIMLNI